ncbi:hypothetical protein VHEMI10728 [[Torrubiella] hemipterigena]|uniref:Uncharacterized protein n=1 Tax=[Torrubiella] hemipterigena TaxID=1531966 RepID=A0A0A1TTN8_9HYPO|nr:hypothetical protein VHEMI10728 [[Torrubiella] hemipterigena]
MGPWSRYSPLQTPDPDTGTMNIEQTSSFAPLSRTPPNQPALPPSPPPTKKSSTSTSIASVRDLQHYCKDHSLLDEVKANEYTNIPLSKTFQPHYHITRIEQFIRCFDCYPTSILVRMPSPILEFVISGLEREYTIQQFLCGGKWQDVKLGRSSRVFLDNKNESRQPDIKFRHKQQHIPRVIIEVAYTQTEKGLDALASDYILKSDGEIKTVIGVNLNPWGKPSTVQEWKAVITDSDDPEYDEELRVERGPKKVFREADGSPANEEECITIPYSDFSDDSNAQEPGISISLQKIFEIYGGAEDMNTRSEVEEVDRPTKRVKCIGRTPSPIEQLKPEAEAKFLAAEKAAEDVGI